MHSEPEWDQEQVDLAIAFDLVESEPRGDHGHPFAESVGAQANPDNPDGTHVYRGLPPLTDWAKRAELDASDEYRAALEASGMDAHQITAQMRALHFPVAREERIRD